MNITKRNNWVFAPKNQVSIHSRRSNLVMLSLRCFAAVDIYLFSRHFIESYVPNVHLVSVTTINWVQFAGSPAEGVRACWVFRIETVSEVKWSLIDLWRDSGVANCEPTDILAVKEQIRVERRKLVMSYFGTIRWIHIKYQMLLLFFEVPYTNLVVRACCKVFAVRAYCERLDLLVVSVVLLLLALSETI